MGSRSSRWPRRGRPSPARTSSAPRLPRPSRCCSANGSPGAHVNAVGSSVAFTRELDTAAVVKARLFVDRRESTINEAGDFLFPKKEGAIGDDHIRGEIGQLLLGQVAGRTSPNEVTLFKSLGLAVEDLAAAHHIYEKALEKGLGTAIELRGSRHGDA